MKKSFLFVILLFVVVSDCLGSNEFVVREEISRARNFFYGKDFLKQESEKFKEYIKQYTREFNKNNGPDWFNEKLRGLREILIEANEKYKLEKVNVKNKITAEIVRIDKLFKKYIPGKYGKPLKSHNESFLRYKGRYGDLEKRKRTLSRLKTILKHIRMLRKTVEREASRLPKTEPQRAVKAPKVYTRRDFLDDVRDLFVRIKYLIPAAIEKSGALIQTAEQLKDACIKAVSSETELEKHKKKLGESFFMRWLYVLIKELQGFQAQLVRDGLDDSLTSVSELFEEVQSLPNKLRKVQFGRPFALKSVDNLVDKIYKILEGYEKENEKYLREFMNDVTISNNIKSNVDPTKFHRFVNGRLMKKYSALRRRARREVRKIIDLLGSDFFHKLYFLYKMKYPRKFIGSVGEYDIENRMKAAKEMAVYPKTSLKTEEAKYDDWVEAEKNKIEEKIQTSIGVGDRVGNENIRSAISNIDYFISSHMKFLQSGLEENYRGSWADPVRALKRELIIIKREMEKKERFLVLEKIIEACANIFNAVNPEVYKRVFDSVTKDAMIKFNITEVGGLIELIKNNLSELLMTIGKSKNLDKKEKARILGVCAKLSEKTTIIEGLTKKGTKEKNECERILAAVKVLYEEVKKTSEWETVGTEEVESTRMKVEREKAEKKQKTGFFNRFRSRFKKKLNKWRKQRSR